jgi:isoleucyl-tRNA synthetase
VRLWVASVDFREDVVGSEKLMQRTAETYRDIRNKLFRYVLSNLFDFDPAQDAVAFEQLRPVDQYILRQTSVLADDVVRWYDEFAFHKIYQRVTNFVIVELSAFYVDVVKDRLYTFAPKSAGRRAAQTALWRIGEALTRLLAPIMSFTSDEAWQYLPKLEGRPGSVHMAKFPTSAEILGGDSIAREDAQQKSDWTTLLSIRDQVLKPLEEARAKGEIGKSLEAQVKLTASDPLYAVLERHRDDLRYLFIVSQVSLERGSGNGSSSLQVEISRAAGEKCERCWNYSIRVGEDAKYPTVCERCAPVLHELDSEPGASKS